MKPPSLTADMNDHEKRELLVELSILEDEKRQDNYENYLKNYEPHPKQQEFHASTAVIRLFLGGNQSGKSRAGYSESVSMAIGYRPWDGTKTIQTPSKVLIVGKDFKNHHSEITLPYLRKMIPRSMIASVERGNQGEITKFTLKNGSVIKLMSYEQHLKNALGQVSPFEGHMWDFIQFDEPPPYGVYTACHRGIIAREGRMAFTLTPLACPWIYDKLYIRAGYGEEDQEGKSAAIHAIIVKIWDNPHLSKEFVSEFLASLSSDEREAREHGKFMHLIGLVYKCIGAGAHRIKRKETEIGEDWPKGLVMDPHDRRPCALGWFAINPLGNIVFFDEWPDTPFYDMKNCPLGHSVENYAEMIHEREKTIPGGADTVIFRLMDPNFGRGSKLGLSDASLVDAFARHGLYFRTDIKDNITEGHIEVARRLEYNAEEEVSPLNQPKLYWTDNCYNINYGMTHYIWQDWRMEGKALKETPSDEFKDYPDLLRYACMFDPPYFSVSERRGGIASYIGNGGRNNSGLG